MSNVETIENNAPEGGRGRGVKRKKKKSFLQNARKYGRKGTYGRGSHLDEDTYQYMIRVLELMRDDAFPSSEEKLIFVNNVYEQMIEHEVEYARNQVGSRVIDSLLRYANFDVINRFATAFKETLRPICSDRFASHVLQKIITVCAERGTRVLNDTEDSKTASENTNNASKDSNDRIENPKSNIKEPYDDENAEAYNQWTITLSKYISNNLEDFVWDTYANHIVRTVVELLGGLMNLVPENADNMYKKNLSIDYSKRKKVPQEYTELLLEICRRLCSWPQFAEFAPNELTSGLLQVLLYSIKEVDKKLSKTMVQKIMDHCFDSGEDTKVSNAFGNESSTRLLEACIATATPKMYAKIHAKLFGNRLETLSLMAGANFTVQRLFNQCQSKELLETMFDEISVHFPAVIEKGYVGVVSSVADACKRLQTRQGAFVTAMAKTLKCDEPAERQNSIALLVAKMVTFDKLKTDQSDAELRINLHGSLILQSMLHFNKPIKIINSLLETDAIVLRKLFSDPRGSRVMDAFAESKYIGEKSREKMARKLGGSWVQLACSKHGSRSLEKVWQWSQVKQKLWIMEELAQVGANLQSTEVGKIIYNKLNVPLFSRSKKEWIDSLGKQEKTKALFADIIGNSTTKCKT